MGHFIEGIGNDYHYNYNNGPTWWKPLADSTNFVNLNRVDDVTTGKCSGASYDKQFFIELVRYHKPETSKTVFYYKTENERDEALGRLIRREG